MTGMNLLHTVAIIPEAIDLKNEVSVKAWYVIYALNMQKNRLIVRSVADMKIDRWIGNCKVTGFPWIDKKRYYINVQYFKSGQSIEKPPAWDKSVYITMNEKYFNIINNYLDSLVNYIIQMDMPEIGEVTLTF